MKNHNWCMLNDELYRDAWNEMYGDLFLSPSTYSLSWLGHCIKSCGRSISYGGETPDTINTCTVWGYARNNDNTVNTTPFTVYLEKDFVIYKTNTIIRSYEITVTPDDTGYWEVEVIETDNMQGSPKYIFKFAIDHLEYKQVTDQTTASYGDL